MSEQSSERVTLAPCPFCGGESYFACASRSAWVRCPSCSAEGPVLETENAAIAAWNRRAALSTPAKGSDLDCEGSELRSEGSELAVKPDTASTGEGEVERLKAGLKDEINFDINTRTNKVPESVVDQVVDLLAARNLLALAALPPSSGWEAGAEAMREAAARCAENAHLVEPDGGSPTREEYEVAQEAARRIRALPLPPPPSREGA